MKAKGRKQKRKNKIDIICKRLLKENQITKNQSKIMKNIKKSIDKEN